MATFGELVCMVVLCCAILLPESTRGQQGCGEGCQTLNDCPGQLICTDGKCSDDPDVGTHICSPAAGGGGTDDCQPSGTLRGSDGKCHTSDGSECCQASKTYTTYTCSPPVSSQTPAVLTWNDFGEDGSGSGGAESECDGRFHGNSERIVALSTGWFDNKRRCGKQMSIQKNGKSVLAKVVDECDSTVGCDKEHDFQPPCPNNIVDASTAVWHALGLNTDDGTVDVTWSDA